MRFAPGRIIVHPHHGPATVKGISSRTVRDQPRTYVDLQIHNTRLTVSVPVENADLVGLREVLDPKKLAELFDVLGAPSPPEDPRWAHRFKENKEKLSTGSLKLTAEVVRDLARRQERKGLSLAERDLLKEASAPLVTELAVALGVGPEDAEAALMAGTSLHRSPMATSVDLVSA